MDRRGFGGLAAVCLVPTVFGVVAPVVVPDSVSSDALVLPMLIVVASAAGWIGWWRPSLRPRHAVAAVTVGFLAFLAFFLARAIASSPRECFTASEPRAVGSLSQGACDWIPVLPIFAGLWYLAGLAFTFAPWALGRWVRRREPKTPS